MDQRACVLIIMPSWIGDSVMATPMLRCLRSVERFANARFVGYMRGGLNEVLAGSGLLDQMIVGQPRGCLGPGREGRRIARQLEMAGGCECVVILPNSFRLALTARCAQVKERVGYDRGWRHFLLSRKGRVGLPPGVSSWKDPISAVDYYLHLALVLGARGIDEHDPTGKCVQLACTEEQTEAGDAILHQKMKFDRASNQRLTLLNVGANRLDKRWPARCFAELADRLHDRTEGRMIFAINGSPAERELVREVCGGVRKARTFNLPELGVTLGSLKRLCEAAELIVTNDTGTRHIAAGMNYHRIHDATSSETPSAIITLFGPTDPAWAEIYYKREIGITTGGKRIDEITVNEVAGACGELGLL